MFVNPKHAIEQGLIRGIRDEAKQVQPNAIDFTLDDLRTIERDHAFLCEDKSRNMMRKSYATEDRDGVWLLDGGRVYDGTSEMYIEVPEGMAAILYTRSSFARNGVFIMSGLYDSGYKGHIGFTIYTIGGAIEIEKGTRIGQIALVSAETAKMYAGGWNHEEGTHYTEKGEQ